MSAIKKFFEKKKLDRKFKKAGEGHVLNSPKSQQSQQAQSQASARAYRPQTSDDRQLTSEQQQAAEAALLRMNHRPTTPSARTGRDVIKAQVKREMEDERRLREEVVSLSSRPKEVHADSSHVTASCGGVFFTSHLLPGVMASKQEVDGKVLVYFKLLINCSKFYLVLEYLSDTDYRQYLMCANLMQPIGTYFCREN